MSVPSARDGQRGGGIRLDQAFPLTGVDGDGNGADQARWAGSAGRLRPADRFGGAGDEAAGSRTAADRPDRGNRRRPHRDPFAADCRSIAAARPKRNGSASPAELMPGFSSSELPGATRRIRTSRPGALTRSRRRRPTKNRCAGNRRSRYAGLIDWKAGIVAISARRRCPPRWHCRSSLATAAGRPEDCPAR